MIDFPNTTASQWRKARHVLQVRLRVKSAEAILSLKIPPPSRADHCRARAPRSRAEHQQQPTNGIAAHFHHVRPLTTAGDTSRETPASPRGPPLPPPPTHRLVGSLCCPAPLLDVWRYFLPSRRKREQPLSTTHNRRVCRRCEQLPLHTGPSAGRLARPVLTREGMDTARP